MAPKFTIFWNLIIQCLTSIKKSEVRHFEKSSSIYFLKNIDELLMKTLCNELFFFLDLVNE